MRNYTVGEVVLIARDKGFVLARTVSTWPDFRLRYRDETRFNTEGENMWQLPTLTAVLDKINTEA